MSSRRSLPRLAAALAVTAVLVLSACSNASSSQTYEYTSATAVGKLIPLAGRKPAANFDGTLLTGKKTSLAATRGKVTIVNFWATWCPPCRVETPQLDLFYRKMKAKGVTVLGIDTKNSPSSQAKAYVAAEKISYPIIYDQQGETALKLGNPPANLPFTYLIDKKGRVAAIYLGGLTDKDLQGPVQQLLAES